MSRVAKMAVGSVVSGSPLPIRRGLFPKPWAGLLGPLLVGLVLAWLPGRALAGAWTQPPGSFYVKASFTVSSADDQVKCCVDESQPLLSATDRGTYWQGDLRLYGEYGLPWDIPGGLTAIGSLAYKFIEIDTQRALRRTEGIGDLELGLRWGLPIEAISPVVLSVQVDATIPTGYTANLPEGQQIPWLGNGIFALTTRLLAGVSFWPVPVYVTGGVGFRWRGQDENDLGTVDYANELPYGFEAGVTIVDRVLIQALLDGVAPLGDLTELDVAALNPPSSRSLAVGGGIIVFIWEGLQANFNYRRTVDGVNVLLANEFAFGLAWAQ